MLIDQIESQARSRRSRSRCCVTSISNGQAILYSDESGVAFPSVATCWCRVVP